MSESQQQVIMKHLISSNPSSLSVGSVTIDKIGRHPTFFVLLPWIATNYPWALSTCFRYPVFELLGLHIRRVLNGEPPNGTARILRELFEAYPLGLLQKDQIGMSPFDYVLRAYGDVESVELFLWMVQVCPPGKFPKEDFVGFNLLHRACICLADHVDSGSSKTCKLLIERCPEYVRAQCHGYRGIGDLPIHFLLKRSQHPVDPIVREIVVKLLREYPVSYFMPGHRYGAAPSDSPNTHPFVKVIKTILDEEVEVKDNICQLQEASRVCEALTNDTDNQNTSLAAVSVIFNDWANVVFIPHLEERLEALAMEIQHECNTTKSEDA